jgi:hypothetical protein
MIGLTFAMSLNWYLANDRENTRGAVMEDATGIRSNIEHYRTLLSLFITDETRQTLERHLAKAKAQLELVNNAARDGPFPRDG